MFIEPLIGGVKHGIWPPGAETLGNRPNRTRKAMRPHKPSAMDGSPLFDVDGRRLLARPARGKQRGHRRRDELLRRRIESAGAATHARGARQRRPARLIIETLFRKLHMPGPDGKWTYQEAHEYRKARMRQYVSDGSIEDEVIALRKKLHLSKGLGGYETTLQTYETRAAKTAGKIAQPEYVNKHGVRETRTQLIERKVRKDIQRAEELNPLVVELGRYVEAMCTGSTFIQGPIKLFESAIRKTMDDNKGVYTDNKDLARCTIAHEETWGVASIASVIMGICTPIYGMRLIKAKERKPVPTDDNPLGYSDWNFAVVFKGSKIPAEMQVNTYALMYSKMSKEDYTRAMLKKTNEYTQCQYKWGFPGGLQHLLYEIVRDKLSTEAEKQAAKEFGIWYTNLARLSAAELPVEAKKCCARYQAFCDSLTSAFAINLIYKHPLDARWGVRPVKPVRPARAVTPR